MLPLSLDVFNLSSVSPWALLIALADMLIFAWECDSLIFYWLVLYSISSVMVWISFYCFEPITPILSFSVLKLVRRAFKLFDCVNMELLTPDFIMWAYFAVSFFDTAEWVFSVEKSIFFTNYSSFSTLASEARPVGLLSEKRVILYTLVWITGTPFSKESMPDTCFNESYAVCILCLAERYPFCTLLGELAFEIILDFP